MCEAVVGAAVTDGGGELGGQFVSEFFIFGVEIGALRRILGKVVQLDGREVFVFKRLRRARAAPAAGAGAKDEFPWAAANGEGDGRWPS